MEKENKFFLVNKDESPPLSARLQQITNNLKSIYSATPIQMKISNETDTSSRDLVVSTDIVEPKTPVTQPALMAKDKWEVADCPSETFSALSCGLKVKVYFLYPIQLLVLFVPWLS